MVRFLDGVRSVEHHIMVETPALTREVQRGIAADLLRTTADEATCIAVHAVRGTGILQGVVHSNAARAAAERAALTVHGVRSVIDSLMVST